MRILSSCLFLTQRVKVTQTVLNDVYVWGQKLINAFIQQGCIQLIKNDSKDYYNVTKYLYFK